MIKVNLHESLDQNHLSSREQFFLLELFDTHEPVMFLCAMNLALLGKFQGSESEILLPLIGCRYEKVTPTEQSSRFVKVSEQIFFSAF